MSTIPKKVRVRFAPSPTGFLHIGGLRTALYNYLFARKNGGDFILRIEDTDRERSVEGGIENIISTLRNCGLEYDEGPEVGGKFGPYIQSERLKIYQTYAKELLEKGAAYYCFCTREELEKEREKQAKAGLPTKYSGKCLKLNKKEIEKKLKDGTAHVARLKVPEKGNTIFEDIIYGKIEVKNSSIDHQVLIKSDNFPTYHLANVIDDHLMKITNVIRGEEWLPSTPKHILLYAAFGWELPKFAHLPLLLNSDRSKLSKRQGDMAVEDYLKKGYLPEALLNFVALLGWNPSGEHEIYSIKELTKSFDLKSVNKAGAVFNLEKLDWMNGEYIRKKVLSELTELCLPYFINAGFLEKERKSLKIKETGERISKGWLKKIIALEQERMKKLGEAPLLSSFFFEESLNYPADSLVWKKSDKKETKKILEKLSEFLVSLPAKKFNKKNLEEDIKKWLEKEGIGTGNALWPMRTALSGLTASPPPFDIAEILGKEKTLKRLNEAAQKL